MSGMVNTAFLALCRVRLPEDTVLWPCNEEVH
jgi:hypothetical protein